MNRTHQKKSDFLVRDDPKGRSGRLLRGGKAGNWGKVRAKRQLRIVGKAVKRKGNFPSGCPKVFRVGCAWLQRAEGKRNFMEESRAGTHSDEYRREGGKKKGAMSKWLIGRKFAHLAGGGRIKRKVITLKSKKLFIKTREDHNQAKKKLEKK